MNEKIEETRVKIGNEMERCENLIEHLLQNLQNNSHESTNLKKKYLELYFNVLKTITILDEWKYDFIQKKIENRSDLFHLNRPIEIIKKLFNERKNILDEYSILKDCIDFDETFYLTKLNSQCQHILSYKNAINILMDGIDQCDNNDFECKF